MLCNVLVGMLWEGEGEDSYALELCPQFTSQVKYDKTFTNILITASEWGVLETSTCFKPNEGGEFIIYEEFQIGSIH
jgi:hypothetical protein